MTGGMLPGDRTRGDSEVAAYGDDGDFGELGVESSGNKGDNMAKNGYPGELVDVNGVLGESGEIALGVNNEAE